MTQAVAQILAQLDTLTQQERAEVAYAALKALEPEESGVEEAWEEELARRVARIRGGQAVGKPAEQVFAEWRRDRS
jgi:putative addiction module component (TIGR02574 family)